MDSNVKIQNMFNTKMLVYCSILIALSFIGAQIKIFQSIAFDSLPAFFAALFLGPVAGAIVGGLGHLFTALTSGFPYTVPVHLVIAVSMAIICYIFGYLNGRINIIFNSIIATVLNGVVATYISVFAMNLLGIIPSVNEMFISLVGILTVVSGINVFLASTIYKTIGKKITK
ncbi:MAG: ECF transporter S component [Eubacteriaceae bacterium]